MTAEAGVRTIEAAPPAAGRAVEIRVLLAGIAAVAGCGLIYELLIATVSSYLLGSSVTQFSISVGLFVGAMGLGSWLSQRITRGLLLWFAGLEMLLGLVGGVSATVLFWVYSLGIYYWPALIFFIAATGVIVGLELPLLVRVLNQYGELRQTIAGALSVDYAGSLLGSLLFPLVLLPSLGVTRTAFLVGLINLAVAAWVTATFAPRLPVRPIYAACAAAGLLLGAGFWQAGRIHHLLEQRLYDDNIIYARQTPYQRIVLTRWRDDLRLYIDGNLQFSTTDEYRYHETLIHPALSAAASRRNILVLGGGDGLAVREILRWPDAGRVTLVDLDPEMTRLGRNLPVLRRLNEEALHDRRVEIIHADAHRFLERDGRLWDVVVADLPDPNSEPLARLYSREFYRLAARRLARGGIFVTQATSPFFAREAFWCIVASAESAGLAVLPYHTYVPSFGDWGFVLMGRHRPSPSAAGWPAALRFLDPPMLPELTRFPLDAGRIPIEPSSLDRPRVLDLYLEGTRRWDTP